MSKSIKDVCTISALRKLGQLIKSTINHTKEIKKRAILKTRNTLDRSSIIGKIIRVIFAISIIHIKSIKNNR